ncbi:MAG: TRAP transporter small permease [Chitinophagales bacterium]
MNNFTNAVERFSQFLDKIAGFFIFATMAVMIINIILRTLFNFSLVGTSDYVNVFTALSVAMALAYCAFNNGQIAVEFLVDRFPVKVQGVLDALLDLIGIVFWGWIAWYMILYAHQMSATGLLSTTAMIPLSPVAFLIAAGLIALDLVIVIRFTNSIRKVIQ